MHRIKWMCILLLFGACTAVLGSTKLTCTSVDPKINSTVVCECEEIDGSDIKWLKDDNLFSACSASNDYCTPEPSQYILNYTKTGSVAYYNLTISLYDYTYCGKYTCSDFSSPPVSSDVSISINAFDSRLQPQIEEPLSNHSNGNINFTTGCIFQTIEVAKNVKWYKLVNDDEIELDRSKLKTSNDSSSCYQCSGEQASKLIIRYDHKEATGAGVEEVRFRVTLFHNQNKSDILNMTTKNYYYIKGDITTSPSPTQNNATPTFPTVKNMTTSASLRNTVSDGSNTTGCACDIKDALIVVAVAWAGALIFTVIGSCIYRCCCEKIVLLECVFSLATVPLILIIVVMLLYKKGRNKMILFLFSCVLDVLFIGIVICICFLTEICGLPDLLWASFIYVIFCGLSSVLKCIVIEKSKRDRNVANKNSDSKQNEENVHVNTPPSKEHGRPGTRKPLPRIPSINSRLGNVKEHEHSLKTLYPTHIARLPPISQKEKG